VKQLRASFAPLRVTGKLQAASHYAYFCLVVRAVCAGGFDAKGLIAKSVKLRPSPRRSS
jgi:hypothetical protein